MLSKLRVKGMPVTLILFAALTAGYPILYGAMYVRERIAVAKAISAEETRGIAICNGRVSEIEKQHNNKVAKGVAEARRAGNLLNATPEDKAELINLCNRSASCRSRGAF